MISNPLFDTAFLKQLIEQKNREIFARITALTINEMPIEYIEGKVTGGSINVDGNSAVRRTCTLSMVAQDVNINDFYWGLKNKFRLEIGLKNTFNCNYPEIIWFKQGLYVITSFSTSQSTNNYNINISGKDKMCLLNGDLAGTLPHTTDFGVEEFYDSTTQITRYTSIPIKRIIREAIQNFGNELAQNIIINDIEDAGLELLEYRGDIPLYLFREVHSDVFLNMTLNEQQPCVYFKNGAWVETIIGDNNAIIYDNLIDIDGEKESTIIKLDKESDNSYKIAKFEYGSIPGYRLTDLVYAGDLIANVGESLTSVLDKIKNMLGEFEYFYNLDGKFVFQKKRNRIDIPWHSVEQDDDISVDIATNYSSLSWSFSDSQLISSFQNTPNLLNLRNDFSVWGTKKTVSGAELDIHMRYVIDVKPIEYTSLIDGITYTSDSWDWRELIYRMALDYRRYYHDDDFLYNVAQANPQYPSGHTGYEQYYTDLEGFWRLLYNPNPDADQIHDYFHDPITHNYWAKEVSDNPENLLFWFDFLDAEGSDIAKYSVPAIGARTKALNDKDVKSIYYREIPTTIFQSGEEIYEHQTGYTYVQLQNTMENLFTISSKGKSAKERIEELLYNHAYCTESANISTIPVYHLEPNNRISIQDENSKINGEYIINKLTIPLTYNGMMTITATKAVSNIT